MGGSGSKTYMTGTESEEEIASLVGGKSQQYRKTSLGGRYIDQYIIPYENAGYAGGYGGQCNNLNSITIITQKRYK